MRKNRLHNIKCMKMTCDKSGIFMTPSALHWPISSKILWRSIECKLIECFYTWNLRILLFNNHIQLNIRGKISAFFVDKCHFLFLKQSLNWWKWKSTEPIFTNFILKVPFALVQRLFWQQKIHNLQTQCDVVKFSEDIAEVSSLLCI